MADTLNIDAESGRNIIGDDSTPTLTLENTGGGQSLEVIGSSSAGASISGLKLSDQSVASGAVIALGDTAFVSVTSILSTTGGVAGTGAIRVVRTDGSLGWIPVYPDGAVTAAAVE